MMWIFFYGFGIRLKISGCIAYSYFIPELMYRTDPQGVN